MLWGCSVAPPPRQLWCDVGRGSAQTGASAHRPREIHQKAVGEPDGARTSPSKASSQELKGKGKSTRSQPLKSQSNARAAPKQRRKTGIVQSLAATDAEIEQSFSMLLPSRDGKLTIDSLQKVCRSVIQRCCFQVRKTIHIVSMKIALPCMSERARVCISMSCCPMDCCWHAFRLISLGSA